MIWLAIRAALKAFAGTALDAVVKHPFDALFALLVAASAIFWIRGNHFKIQRDVAVAGRAADQKAAFAAQAQAVADQKKLDQSNLAGQIEQNRKLTDDLKASEAARVAAVTDYARTHRVPAPGACRPSGATASAGVPGDPGRVADAAQADPVLSITESRLDTLTKEAMLGAERYQFLSRLVDQGLAIPASELPKPPSSSTPKAQ